MVEYLLRELHIPGKVYAILQGRPFFVIFCSLSYTQFLFWKGVFSKRKEFAPMGKFFPLRENSIAEGDINNFNKVTSPESVFIPLKTANSVEYPEDKLFLFRKKKKKKNNNKKQKFTRITI